MKYEKGDKFIIEIESRVNSQGLYKIRGFNTLVFDDNGLDRLEQVHEHDGCDGCRFFHSDDYPCMRCRNNYTDKFKPKTEEIQVGDEVKYTSPSTEEIEYGIVIQKSNTLIGAIDKDFTFRSWRTEYCTRTGKTYPELIKALAELPKEGE